MTDVEGGIDYAKFQLSLARLEEQYEHLRRDIDGLPNWIVEGVKESVIQRFETCYDTCWKLLRRYLSIEMGVSEVPNGPRPVLRLAAENNLLGNELVDWLSYVQARIDTAHDYNAEKADACLALMPRFIQDAKNLYEKLTGLRWSKTKR